MANNGLPPGATLVSGSLPPAADAPDSQSSTVAGLPPGAKLVSGTVPPAAAPVAPPGTTGVSGVLNKIGEFGAGVGEGAITSMGETIQSLPWVGKKILSPEAMQAEREYFKPGSAAEKHGQTTGDIAEPVLEFVMGDEALKGLAIADKIGIASKIADIAKNSPYIGKLLQHGVNAARMGTVGTTQALARGATLPEALKTGAATGVGGEILSTAAEAAADVLPKVITRINPFRQAAPSIAAATSKIEPAVAARTAKAGLDIGEAGVTPEAAREATKQSAIEAQAATQKNADQALQDIANNHATANGLPAPKVGTASRDILIHNGNALVDAGKADYKILDKFTDGKFTNVQQELKNAQLELQRQAGTTAADTSTLEANVLRAQMKADQLFDTAIENGMPKDLAETARTKFKTGQATLDAGNAVRMTNRARGATGARTTDLNGLENRWTALHDSGRLQQAFGEKGAQDALTQIRAAREAGEVFESMPPTESQALRDLITKNTTTGKLGTTTNWGKVREAFSQMPDRAARFSDIPKVEKFINNQRFYQRLRQLGAGAVGTVVTGALGTAGYEIGKAALE